MACTKLDRLARSVRHLLVVAGELEALGVDLVVLDQAIDTSSPVRKFTFHILGAVGELERDLIRSRTVAGMAAAHRRGRKIGRPMVQHIPLGRAERLLAQGQSLSDAAKELGVSRTTPHRALSKRVSDGAGLNP